MSAVAVDDVDGENANEAEAEPVFAGTPLGCCSNCFRRLPRDPKRKGGVIRAVEITHPETSQKTRLSLVDALHYIFRDRPLPPGGLEDDLTFCIYCGPVFRQILKSFCSFVERARTESCVFKFLEPRLPVQVKVEVELTEYPDSDAADSPDFNEDFQLQDDIEIKDEGVDSGTDLAASASRKGKSKSIRIKNQKKRNAEKLSRTKKTDHKSNSKSKKKKRPSKPDDVLEQVWEEFDAAQIQEPEKKKRKKRIRKPPGQAYKKVITEAEAEAEFYTSGEKSVFLKCGNCEETFNALIDWANHQTSAHNKSAGWGDNPLPTFSDGRERLCKKLPCPECWKPFATSHIRDHIEGIHKHNFPYSCEACGKGFISAQALKVHSRIHEADGTRPHLCLLCGDSFTQKAALTRHELCHSGTLKKPHQCEECGASFEFSSRLERHRVTHTPSAERPKPFPCQICPRQFESKSRLNIHLRNHKRSIERPAKCAICGKDYTRNSGLKDHLMTVHGMTDAEAKVSAGMRDGVIPIILPGQEIQRLRKPTQKPGLTCSFCGKSYSRREYLTSHIVSGHGKSEAEAKEITGLETIRKLPPASACIPGTSSDRGLAVRRRKRKAEVIIEGLTGDSSGSEVAMDTAAEEQVETPEPEPMQEVIQRPTLIMPPGYPTLIMHQGQRDEWTINPSYPYSFS